MRFQNIDQKWVIRVGRATKKAMVGVQIAVGTRYLPKKFMIPQYDVIKRIHENTELNIRLAEEENNIKGFISIRAIFLHCTYKPIQENLKNRYST